MPAQLHGVVRYTKHHGFGLKRPENKKMPRLANRSPIDGGAPSAEPKVIAANIVAQLGTRQ